MPPRQPGQQVRGKNARTKASSRPKKGGFLSLGTILIIVVAVAAVGGVLAWGVSAGGKGKAGEREFPAYAYNSAATLAGYKAAVAHPDQIKYIPCYCGCGGAEGHQSLKECFFKPNGDLNEHASGCHICVGEAADVAKWLDDGRTLKDIRTAIENKWGKDGGGTETLPVPAGL